MNIMLPGKLSANTQAAVGLLNETLLSGPATEELLF